MKTTRLSTMLICIAAFASNKISAQSLDWAWAFVSNGNAMAVNAAVPDASGNVYVTGAFDNTTDFDLGPADVFITCASDYGDDIFISKLDAEGNLIWVRTFGSSEDGLERGLSLVIDAASNIYVGGMFSGTIDFDPGTGATNGYCSGTREAFILKLDSDGNFVWVRTAGGSGNDQVNAMVLDLQGNICVTGNFSSSAYFDSTNESLQLSSSGGSNSFILKYDPDGNIVWLKGYGGTAFDVDIDNSGNIYTTGHFVDEADFDPGTQTYNLTSYGAEDIFISKLDPEGSFIWAKQMGGTDGDKGYSIFADATGGAVLTGYFNSDASLDPNSGAITHTSNGNSDAFVCKLNEDGDLSWANQYGSTSVDEGRSICIDALGNIYCSGNFSGTADFDPTLNEFNMTSNGASDLYLSKLNANGQMNWAVQIGGTGLEYTRWIFANEQGDEIYIGLNFSGTVDFDPYEGVYNLSGTNYGGCALKLGPTSNNIINHSLLLQSLAYPNPTNGPIVFELKTPCNFLTASVHNQLGQQVLQKSFSNSKRIELNIVGAEGLYYAELTTDSGMKFSYIIMKE
jgi:hypothetical protein